MNKKQAQEKLRIMWENGELPSNFTEDHSEYSKALNQLIKSGSVDWDEIL